MRNRLDQRLVGAGAALGLDRVRAGTANELRHHRVDPAQVAQCLAHPRFMESKNSELVFVSFILSMRNSTAASSSIGCRSFLRIQILASSSWAVISSSRRVPERLMLNAGNTRFSEMRRSRWISLLPVPLNSS